jgi:hypothetical protein
MVQRDEMTTRERFRAVMNFQPVDRLPMVEWATWWDQTLARWYREGLPREITDRCDLYRHFGLELYPQDWISLRTADCPQPPGHGLGLIDSMDQYRKIRPYLFPQHCVEVEWWRKCARRQQTGDGRGTGRCRGQSYLQTA